MLRAKLWNHAAELFSAVRAQPSCSAVHGLHSDHWSTWHDFEPWLSPAASGASPQRRDTWDTRTHCQCGMVSVSVLALQFLAFKRVLLGPPLSSLLDKQDRLMAGHIQSSKMKSSPGKLSLLHCLLSIRLLLLYQFTGLIWAILFITFSRLLAWGLS